MDDGFPKPVSTRMQKPDALIERGKKMDISPYELAKRQMGYRSMASCGALWTKPACSSCGHKVTPRFRSGKEGMQCELIGVMDEDHAWISANYTCDKAERRK